MTACKTSWRIIQDILCGLTFSVVYLQIIPMTGRSDVFMDKFPLFLVMYAK